VVQAFTSSLRQELRPWDIHVASVTAWIHPVSVMMTMRMGTMIITEKKQQKKEDEGGSRIR
jgi:hypothetical protein